jgi:hypothetical protein
MASTPSILPGHKLAPGHPFFELIEDAYRAFSLPKPTSIEVCDCCMDSKIHADFFNPPIRELPFDYIRDWYWATYQPTGVARSTWAYLLPRILEIMASGYHASNVGVEVSLMRFRTGNRDNWTAAQWDVLDRFQRSYLERTLVGAPEPIGDAQQDCLDDVLCMFTLGGWPLDGLLYQVAATPDTLLAKRLWIDWCKDHVPGREAIWTTTFWEGADNSMVYAFYTSLEMYERMETLALSDDTDSETARQASAVAQVIEQSRN